MMFGWLTHAFATVRSSANTTAWTISRCTVPMSGITLAAYLPLLGSVLYLPARMPTFDREPLPRGWLVASHELAPLLQVEELRVSSMIGANGPREWIDGMTADGHFCARLHLLPDTDYLAWDALLEHASPLPAAPICPSALSCPAGDASIVCFRTRQFAGFDVLDATPLRQVSMLGHDIAREAARSASRVSALD
jgi:hypothetical protein